MVWEMMMKLGMALLFGLLIGIDRQLKQKKLGLETCMVICVASCLVTIVSIHAFDRFAGHSHPNMDPMRLAAQIVSGIGFLGAGVILRRSNEVISGLTSAALIWAASGLGIAIGAGFYAEAACAVLFLIVAVNFVPHLVKAVAPHRLKKRDVAARIVVEPNHKMTSLLQTIERTNQVHGDYSIRHMKIKDMDNGCQRLDLIISAPEKQYTTEIYYYIKQIDHVLSVEVEHL